MWEAGAEAEKGVLVGGADGITSWTAGEKQAHSACMHSWGKQAAATVRGRRGHMCACPLGLSWGDEGLLLCNTFG